MEKRLLITGFDPFGGSASNPSWQAVEQHRTKSEIMRYVNFRSLPFSEKLPRPC